MEQEKLDVAEILKEFSNLPRFVDGRIDYSKSDKAPVLVIFVQDPDGKLLLLKRSEQVLNYKNMWSSLAGFIDEEKPLKVKVLEEVIEELGINKSMINEIRLGEDYEFHDEVKGKIWWRFPVVVKLNCRPEIKLDWEHTETKWIKLSDIERYELVPGTEADLRRLFKE